MYKKVITMTAWRRPEYTEQVIDDLKNCIGFEEYTILPTIEPGYPEVLKVFDGLSNCQIVINDSVLGCSRNTFKALERGFSISDFVVHLEDDTVPGIDSLKYFEWIYNTYKDNKEIFTATAYNRASSTGPKDYFTVYKKRWFTPWMWCTWIDRFEEMAQKWDSSTWDCYLNGITRKNRYEIIPCISRSQNIGEYFGTNNTPDLWRKDQYNPVWINGISDISLENLKYTEIYTPGTDNTDNVPNTDNIDNVTHLCSQTAIAIPNIKPKIGEDMAVTHSNDQTIMAIPNTKPKIGGDADNINYSHQIIIAVPHIRPKIGDKKI